MVATSQDAATTVIKMLNRHMHRTKMHKVTATLQEEVKSLFEPAFNEQVTREMMTTQH